MKWRKRRLKRDFSAEMTMKWIFQKMVWFFFKYLQEFLCFLLAQKLKVTFDRMLGRWWICKVRFTDCCRDWACQHKVNGRLSLTGHQSLEKIPKNVSHKVHSEIIAHQKSEWNETVSGCLVLIRWLVTMNASRQAASMIDEMGQTLWHSTQMWRVKALEAFWGSRVQG